MGAFSAGRRGIDHLQGGYEALESLGRDHVTPALMALKKGIIGLDDATQAAIRDHILRLPKDGSQLPKDAVMGDIRGLLGHTVHQARHGYGGDATAYRAQNFPGDAEGVLLARALQAGGLTAAGAGLASLTHQYQNSFGGPADSQPMTEDQYRY